MLLLVEGVYWVGFMKNPPLPGRSETPAILIPLQQELLWMKHGVFCNTKDRRLLGAISFRDSYFKHHRNAAPLKSTAMLLEWLPIDNF